MFYYIRNYHALTYDHNMRLKIIASDKLYIIYYLLLLLVGGVIHFAINTII
jgi:hypothetical protein